MSTDLSFIGDFNANDHNDEHDDSPLPAGEYYLEVENINLKDTANGQGKGCNVQFDVLGHKDDGSQVGRKVFVWFNLAHSNETAQKIGLAQFASLCKAVGIVAPRGTDELLGAKFVGSIALDKKDNTRNVIKKYSPIEQTAPAQAAATTETAKPKAPWEK